MAATTSTTNVSIMAAPRGRNLAPFLVATPDAMAFGPALAGSRCGHRSRMAVPIGPSRSGARPGGGTARSLGTGKVRDHDHRAEIRVRRCARRPSEVTRRPGRLRDRPGHLPWADLPKSRSRFLGKHRGAIF